jgi:biopolymer transport protein ExbD
MSHGPASTDAVEPNLVPLLDLVLQLLMFFLINVNFVQGVTSTGESLPHSETVSPLDATGADPLILSVKPFRMGVPLGPGKPARDDFKYYSEAERTRLRERRNSDGTFSFKDGETCVMIPTESLTERERDLGRGRDSLIRNLSNTADRLKRIAQDERDLAEREKRDRVKDRRARVDEAGNVTIPVHIRADADVRTGDIYELMDACKDAGFTTVKARALLQRKEGN